MRYYPDVASARAAHGKRIDGAARRGEEAEMDSTAYCPSCGREIQEGWTFCAACGQALARSSGGPASARREVSQAAPIALTALGVLVALLGLFAAGSMELIVLGLAAIFAAGLLEVFTARAL